MSVAEAKAAVRQRILSRLRALPPAAIAAASARLREQLRPCLAGKQRVCIYAPLPHEVNLLPLIGEHPDISFYLPRCLAGRRLSFHLVREPEKDLSPGTWGIPEPAAELPTLSPEEAELIIVPGVAFTRSGKRLGYGGGYYDRFLPLCPRADKISLCLPEQLLSDLPSDPLDCAVKQLIIYDLRISIYDLENLARCARGEPCRGDGLA